MNIESTTDYASSLSVALSRSGSVFGVAYNRLNLGLTRLEVVHGSPVAGQTALAAPQIISTRATRPALSMDLNNVFLIGYQGPLETVKGRWGVIGTAAPSKVASSFAMATISSQMLVTPTQPTSSLTSERLMTSRQIVSADIKSQDMLMPKRLSASPLRDKLAQERSTDDLFARLANSSEMLTQMM